MSTKAEQRAERAKRVSECAAKGLAMKVAWLSERRGMTPAQVAAELRLCGYADATAESVTEILRNSAALERLAQVEARLAAAVAKIEGVAP